jgi:hypothetical protein
MPKIKRDRFSISEDEMNSRMEQKQKEQVEPAQKGVALLEAACDKVLNSLGVDTSNADLVAKQMVELSIVMDEHTDERAPQLNGFFFYICKMKRKFESLPPGIPTPLALFEVNGELFFKLCDMIPYAWVGAVRVNSRGEVFCDIQWFQDNRLTETGGEKIIH